VHVDDRHVGSQLLGERDTFPAPDCDTGDYEVLFGSEQAFNARGDSRVVLDDDELERFDRSSHAPNGRGPEVIPPWVAPAIQREANPQPGV